MKRILSFSILVIITTLYSCTDRSKLIAQTWNMQEMDIAEQKLDGQNVSGFSLDIKADGTFKMSAMEEVTGKWKISGDSFVTKNDKVTQSSGLLIKELSSEKLVLTGTSEGVPMSMVFVPKK